MLRVAHVITGLTTGGAEMMLSRLIRTSQGRTATHSVFPLRAGGDLQQTIAELGARVEPVGMRPGLPDPRAVLRLARMLRSASPDVVQTWLYHGDLVGGLAARMIRVPVVWGIHHSALDASASKQGTRLVQTACGVLSGRIPARIVACSESTVRAHVAAGYASARFVVVSNGFDLQHFAPNPAARGALRAALSLTPDAEIVGHVGRWDPNKDYSNLLAAARHVVADRPLAHFVLVGEGLSPRNRELCELVGPLASRTHLLGRRSDVPLLMAGFDVLCQSSSSEGFPNALGEAMASGVPCAATDVGDSALIVGDTGRIAPPRDPAALAAAVLSLLDCGIAGRESLGRAARKRIAEQYGIERVTAAYLRTWKEAAGR